MGSELAFDLSPLIRIYKDGRVDRFMGTATFPPSLDEKTEVQSKDVVVSSNPFVSMMENYIKRERENYNSGYLVILNDGSIYFSLA